MKRRAWVRGSQAAEAMTFLMPSASSDSTIRSSSAIALTAVRFFAMIFDYAKVRAVVEDRRSMLGAIAAAVGFIRRNGAAAGLLFLANVALFALVVGVYSLFAPGAGGSDLSMWSAFLLGQLYVLARLWVKLTFWASETALFQDRLAHVGYVARPEPTWPESPAAAAIQS